jgi:hypothetical protein
LLQSESYWQDESTKMACWTGAHESKKEYNAIGQITEVDDYDTDGKLYVGKNGSSRFVKKYDASARLYESSHFDGSKPAVQVNSKIRGFHSVRLSYDDKNRISQIEYLDNNEQPTNAQIDLQEGFECSKIELKYVANILTEERFYPFKSSFPSKTINCLKNDYVDPQGIIFGHKNR